MNQDEIQDTVEWVDVTVDAMRRCCAREERARVVAKLRTASPQKQTMLLTHLDQCPNQQTLFEEDP